MQMLVIERDYNLAVPVECSVTVLIIGQKQILSGNFHPIVSAGQYLATCRIHNAVLLSCVRRHQHSILEIVVTLHGAPVFCLEFWRDYPLQLPVYETRRMTVLRHHDQVGMLLKTDAIVFARQHGLPFVVNDSIIRRIGAMIGFRHFLHHHPAVSVEVCKAVVSPQGISKLLQPCLALFGQQRRGRLHLRPREEWEQEDCDEDILFHIRNSYMIMTQKSRKVAVGLFFYLGVSRFYLGVSQFYLRVSHVSTRIILRKSASSAGKTITFFSRSQSFRYTHCGYRQGSSRSVCAGFPRSLSDRAGRGR